MTNEVVDHAHVAMERALEKNRRHDIGKHEFFDTVEDFTERVNKTFETDNHEDGKTFNEPDMLVRQKPSKVMSVSQAALSNTPTLLTLGIDGQTNVSVQNIGTTDCFVGPSGSSSQTWQGWRVAAGATVSLDYTGPLWGTCNGNTTVCVMALAYGSRD